jgi:hypothetical protein
MTEKNLNLNLLEYYIYSFNNKTDINKIKVSKPLIDLLISKNNKISRTFLNLNEKHMFVKPDFPTKSKYTELISTFKSTFPDAFENNNSTVFKAGGKMK